MKNITPDWLRCNIGFCPAVYELEDDKLLIIGKAPPSDIAKQVAGKVGDDETVIVISRELLANVKVSS